MAQAPGRPRQQGLAIVGEWFAPALQPGETLIAAFAGTLRKATMLNSILLYVEALKGQPPNAVLLLTDQHLYICRRKFLKRRFKNIYKSYRVGEVPVSWGGSSLHVGDHKYWPNASGFQLGHGIGSSTDIELFLTASSK